MNIKHIWLAVFLTCTLMSTEINAAYRVLGVNSAGNLLRKEGITVYDPMGPNNKWTSIPNIPGGSTNAKYVTIGSDGFVWLLTKDNKLYQAIAEFEWVSINLPPGGIVQMDAGLYTLVAVTPEGKVYYLKDISKDNPSGNAWELMSGTETMNNISISSSGKLWGVDKNTVVFNRDGIDSKYNWNKVSGNLTQISVGSDDIPFGVNKSNENRLYKWNGGSFDDISERFYRFYSAVAKGNQDQVWALLSDNNSAEYYQRSPESFRNLGGSFTQIAVGAIAQALPIRKITISNPQPSTVLIVRFKNNSGTERIYPPEERIKMGCWPTQTDTVTNLPDGGCLVFANNFKECFQSHNYALHQWTQGSGLVSPGKISFNLYRQAYTVNIEKRKYNDEGALRTNSVEGTTGHNKGADWGTDVYTWHKYSIGEKINEYTYNVPAGDAPYDISVPNEIPAVVSLQPTQTSN